MRFEFATAGRIVFGPGTAAEVHRIAREFGSRAMVVTGRNPERAASLGLTGIVFPVDGEPTVDIAREGARTARDHGCDIVVSVGGGSAIDAGKAIAALATNSGEPLDYIEVVGRGLVLTAPPLPFIAIPTTAGTGSEVTRNAVLGSTEHGVKASLRSPMMLPEVAVIDPELTLDLPPAVTASTGLDALTQLIEPYVSVRANVMTDGFCRDGMRHAAAGLLAAYQNGQDLEAREAMSMASLMGGLALANAGLGVVHGFAAPIGGMLNAPHGAICAALLPHGMAVNIEALRQRAPDHPALCRYDEIARILTRNPPATAEDGVACVRELCARLAIPPLATYGVTVGLVPELVAKAAQASSMKGNPIPLTTAELAGLVHRAM